jgi:hypothetical protein
MKLNIKAYNEKFAGDYNWGVGSYGAQRVDFFPTLKVAVITIVVHGDFERVRKTFEELEGCLE